MTYFVSAFLQDVHRASIDIHTESLDEDKWERFNASIRSLGQHGQIKEIRQAGNWHERFDIVKGVISGIEIVIYGPRFRDHKPPEVVPTPPESDEAKRDLVRQLEAELKAQA